MFVLICRDFGCDHRYSVALAKLQHGPGGRSALDRGPLVRFTDRWDDDGWDDQARKSRVRGAWHSGLVPSHALPLSSDAAVGSSRAELVAHVMRLQAVVEGGVQAETTPLTGY